MVVGFVVRVFQGSDFRHLSRFMRVARFLVAVAPRFLFLFLSVLHSLAVWPFLLHLKHCFVLVPCVLWFFFQFFLLELTSMAQLSEAVALSYTSATSLSFSQVSSSVLTSRNLLEGSGSVHEPVVLFLGDKLGHLLPDCLLAVEYGSPSVR